MKSKKIMMILLILITILGFSTISNAALESKAGQTSWSSTSNGQFTNIRAMEKIGETLGQNANIDGTTYLDSSNNGIDVHMALATEWGSVSILAVSDYGAYNTKGVVNDKDTKVAATTGNITGVFQMADERAEYVSGVLKDGNQNYISKICSADSRYRNEYTTTPSEYHRGDAVYQTSGWYDGGQSNLAYGGQSYLTTSTPIFYRINGLFGFATYAGGYYAGNGNYVRNL